jgi:PLP dependent protein
MSFITIKSKVEKEYNATLVAVSKTRTNEQILAIYNQGQRIFGENRVQELIGKKDELPQDIIWHIIGSLQKNKVKYIAPFIDMVQSVDSFDLAKTIDKEASKNHRIIKVLLQVKIANEDTKQGFDIEDLILSLKNEDWSSLKNIVICGVMGMGTLVANDNQTRSEFQNLNNHFNLLKLQFFSHNPEFKEISMGMSGDYEIALAEGSTMVRIGSALFLD